MMNIYSVKRTLTFGVAMVAALFISVPTASAEGDVLAGFKKGFFLKSADGDFKLKIGARVQTRYQYDAIDGIGCALYLLATTPDELLSVMETTVSL